MKSKSKKVQKYLIVTIAVVLVTITFTPIILSPGKIHPTLFSLPYSLWTTMLITIILIVLTYLASKVQGKD